MKELVEFLARSLVDRPDAVNVTEVRRDDTTIIELRVAPEDVGKVIGRQGRTARAMRAIMAATTTGSRRRCALDIID